MLMNQTENDLDRRDRRAEERLAADRHFHVLGFLLVLLAAAMMGLAWYGLPRLRQHEITLAQFPSALKAIDVLSDRIKDSDSKMQAWSADRQTMRDEIKAAAEQAQTKMDGLRKQLQSSSAALLRQAQAQYESRLQPVQDRLGALESTNESDRRRIAALQQELIQVRQEVARQATELSGVRRELDRSQVAHQTQFAELRDGQQHNRHDVDAIRDQLAVERIDFEVPKNQSREIAGGISLCITGTNVAYRRVNGYVWVMPDRRTIWLRGHGALEPVVFYESRDGRKRELVITAVSNRSATGYLLLPKESGETTEPAPSRAGE